jgi:hypothetical protein
MQAFFYNHRTYYVRQVFGGLFEYKPEFGHWTTIRQNDKKYYDSKFWGKFSAAADALRRRLDVGIEVA